jgi:hypothetical protein
MLVPRSCIGFGMNGAMRGVVKAERAHPEPLLGELCGRIELVAGNISNDLIQSDKMIAHIAKHVLLHGLRQADEFS